MKKLFILGFFLHAIFLINTNAQDTLYLQSGEKVIGWVVEQSEKEIKYRITNTADSPVIVLSASKVSTIHYRNGDLLSVRNRAIRMDNRTGLSVGLLYWPEIGLFKAQVDYFIIPEVNILVSILTEGEGGAAGIAAGSCWYISPYTSPGISPFTGLQLGVIDSDFFLQLPVGISYAADIGFEGKFVLNALYAPQESVILPLAELSLGWRF